MRESDSSEKAPELCKPEGDAVSSNVSESSLESQKPENFEIPDGGYGWFVVFASFLVNFSTWGANSGYAVFFSYYLNHLVFSGADKYDYALIGGMRFGLAFMLFPVVHFVQGRVGTRITMLFGNCCQFAALMMASFATRLWQVYLTQGLLQAVGLAFVSLPALSIIPQWFKKKRAFASSLAAAGSGCGGVVYNLGMQKVIEVRSVSWALRSESIICFGLLWISVFAIRPRIEVKYAIFDIECFKSVAFLLLCIYLVFCMFGYVVVLYTMANVTTSMGYTPYQGSISSAMVQVGSVLGRPVIGKLCDHFGAVTVSVGAYLVCGIFVLAMWIPALNYATILVFCIIAGSLMGTVFATIPAILASLFGLERVGVCLCMGWVFLGAASIVSPIFGLALKTGNHGYVSPGQYHFSALFCGLSFLVCSFTLLIMRGYLVARNREVENDDKCHIHVRVSLREMVKNCLGRERLI